jgi:hypothetical protein
MGTPGNRSKIGRLEVSGTDRNGVPSSMKGGHYAFAVAL